MRAEIRRSLRRICFECSRCRAVFCAGVFSLSARLASYSSARRSLATFTRASWNEISFSICAVGEAPVEAAYKSPRRVSYRPCRLLAEPGQEIFLEVEFFWAAARGRVSRDSSVSAGLFWFCSCCVSEFKVTVRSAAGAGVLAIFELGAVLLKDFRSDQHARCGRKQGDFFDCLGGSDSGQ